MDIAFCKKGLPLNVEGKHIVVNKRTCIGNNASWYDEKKKACQFPRRSYQNE